MAPAGPGGQLTKEIIRVTCSRFGRHSASSHRPEQQQPSSQPEVSGRNGPGGEPQRGDGPGPDPGALHPLHEGVSQRRPAPTRVQEDLRRSQQLRRGVALHRDHLPLLRHQPGERQGSSLWALASGLWPLGSGLCFFSAFCSLLAGQHAGLPGVRGGAAPHPAGEPGGPTQVVLQDVRQGREREAGPPRGQAAHQGQTFDQTLRTEFTPRTRAFIMSLAAPSPPQPFRSISTCLTGLVPPGVMSYLSGSGSISGVGLTRFSPNGHSARLHFHF